MTNKEDGDTACENNPRMAALLAVHLVSQILDEAYIIANAARESGQSWRNMSMLKSFKTSRLCDTGVEDASLEASKSESDLNENKEAIVANVVATSTPQKVSEAIHSSGEADVSESILITGDNAFIGQGDEDIEAQENELGKSTSMFINHLFDMSEVERIVICDDTEIIQSNAAANDLISETMNRIMESYVVNNFNSVIEAFPLEPDVEIIDRAMVKELDRSGNTDYIFATDALAADINRDVTFYIEDEHSREKHDDMYQSAVVEEIVEVNLNKSAEQVNDNKIQTENDVALYENAYATLNRDYEQESEEEAFPILQDPRAITLQEVELITADDTSDEELRCLDIKRKEKEQNESAPTVSAVSGSRKSKLAHRCRVQGARLLACFRGWWRRKTPGKRKDSRCGGAVIGMCPLSPDARRRASSLLDNRLLRSPSPSRPVIWKFNTVNEALVNSNHWKEYTFDTKPENCCEVGEF